MRRTLTALTKEEVMRFKTSERDCVAQSRSSFCSQYFWRVSGPWPVLSNCVLSSTKEIRKGVSQLGKQVNRMWPIGEGVSMGACVCVLCVCVHTYCYLMTLRVWYVCEWGNQHVPVCIRRLQVHFSQLDLTFHPRIWKWDWLILALIAVSMYVWRC